MYTITVLNLEKLRALSIVKINIITAYESCINIGTNKYLKYKREFKYSERAYSLQRLLNYLYIILDSKRINESTNYLMSVLFILLLDVCHRVLK